MAALVHLSTQTASSSSAISFTSGITSTYDKYMVELNDVRPATEAHFILEVSTDAGSTWKTAAGDYSWEAVESRRGEITTRTGPRDDRMMLTGGKFLAGNGTEDALAGTLRFSDPSSATSKQIFYWQAGMMTGTDLISLTGTGLYRSATAVDGIRFKFSSGNIASGSFSLYGLAKA